MINNYTITSLLTSILEEGARSLSSLHVDSEPAAPTTSRSRTCLQQMTRYFIWWLTCILFALRFYPKYLFTFIYTYFLIFSLFSTYY